MAHCFRYKCAVQRGSFHCYGVAKLKSDPNLCELFQTALRGHLAAKSIMGKNSHNLSTEELLQNQQFIEEGQVAERIICNYVNFLLKINVILMMATG